MKKNVKDCYSIEYVAKRLQIVKDGIVRVDLFGQTRLTVWYINGTSQTFLVHSANQGYANLIMAYIHNKTGGIK